MDKYLERSKLSKFTQEETDYTNSSILSKITWFVVKTFPIQEIIDPDGFTREFCQTFKQEIISILFWINFKRKMFPINSTMPALLWYWN